MSELFDDTPHNDPNRVEKPVAFPSVEPTLEDKLDAITDGRDLGPLQREDGRVLVNGTWIAPDIAELGYGEY